jgi:hypothetical protein
VASPLVVSQCTIGHWDGGGGSGGGGGGGGGSTNGDDGVVAAVAAAGAGRVVAAALRLALGVTLLRSAVALLPPARLPALCTRATQSISTIASAAAAARRYTRKSISNSRAARSSQPGSGRDFLLTASQAAAHAQQQWSP